MRIKSLIVKNFRSFNDQGIRIDFPDIKKPFSIVGHNNSGKSNLVNAILYGMGHHTTSDSTFSDEDFYCKDVSKKFTIQVEVDDPLKSTGAYNAITPMPVFELDVTCEEGIIERDHYFRGKDGKKVFNPRALKRSTKITYSDEDKEVLSKYQKTGAETVWKWRSDVPLYFVDSASIEKQLSSSNYTLLGKVISEVRKNFESKSNTVPNIPGVVPGHIGKPRKEVFDHAIEYLENHVLSTQAISELIEAIEQVIKTQLEIDKHSFGLRFGFPSADTLFKNLEFYLTDNPKKPKLPVRTMGRGFISLFVVALFRAIADFDDGGKIIIIEEPETFLHEHFQEYYYQVLCKLAEKNQVIFTTHSKTFVDVFEPQSVIKLRNLDYLVSTIVHTDGTTPFEVAKEIHGVQLNNPDDFAKYMRSLEPNLGNILFAKKVIIVEGPHDVLAYKTACQSLVNFGLNNIAIVAAWGKDALLTIIDLCNLFEIEYFVVHDWDLDDDVDPNTRAAGKTAEEKKRLIADKQQWTKNKNILTRIKKEQLRHCNKRNLESVLQIERNQKGTIAIHEKLNGKDLKTIRALFPNLISENLIAFLDLKKG